MGGLPSIFDDSDQEADNGTPGYKNVQFYRNEIRSKPRSGHKIEDMLDWLGDYKKLENDHGYIQWLFPIPGSRGKNHYAQELHEHEAQAIRDDDTMRCRVLQAYIMMLDFYGMRLADDTSGEIIKTPYNWKERFDNLNRSPHNYRRISRIITSLGELGFERFQVPLVTFLMEMAIVRKELPNLTGGCMWDWIEAIKDPQERGQTHKNYRELLKYPQTSLREIERDTEAGSSQNFVDVDIQGTPEGNFLRQQLQGYQTESRVLQDEVRASETGSELVSHFSTFHSRDSSRSSHVTTQKRSRRQAQSAVDAQRNACLRVRITALDSPLITDTANINLTQLAEKNLGRRADTTLQVPLSYTYDQLKERAVGLFPALEGIEVELLLGRRGSQLVPLPGSAVQDIKAVLPKSSLACLWLRPMEPIVHIQVDTPVITAGRATAEDTTVQSTPQTAVENVLPVPVPPREVEVLPSHVELMHNFPVEDILSAHSPLAVSASKALPPNDISDFNTGIDHPPVQTSNSSPQPELPVMEDSLHLELEVSVDEDISTVIDQLRIGVGGDQQPFTVRRTHIVDDVMNEYETVDVMKNILVSFEGEVGLDQGGLTKEMFSCFWQEASLQYLRGNNAKVLWISKNKRTQARKVFQLLGKMFEHQVRLLGTVPVEFSKSSLIAMSSLGDEVDPDILITDLISFLPESDSLLLQRCLGTASWSEGDKRRIIRLFSIYSMPVLPTPDNLREHLVNLAFTELLDSSSNFLGMFKAGMTTDFKTAFMRSLTVNNICRLKMEQNPTPEKVAQLIDEFYEQTDLTVLQQVVVSHLCNFIRELNKSQLLRFLRWVTGSCAMPQSLEVIFNGAVGLARAPVAHTCGNLIEVSTQYESYEEFKREMSLVIASDEAFSFGFI